MIRLQRGRKGSRERQQALMATMTTIPSYLQHLLNFSFFNCLSLRNNNYSNSISFLHTQLTFSCNRLLLFSSNPTMRVLKNVGVNSICAVGSGMEASIAETKEKLITLKNVKIVVESQEEDKMQVRVDLSGDETQKVFNMVLTDLACSAPPIPGFRREKGGHSYRSDFFCANIELNLAVHQIMGRMFCNYDECEHRRSRISLTSINEFQPFLFFACMLANPGKTTKVPREVLLQILGEDRVTNFVIQEIVTSTMANYVKKENLKVRENKISTNQKAEELKKVFVPVNEFGFNAVLELEKPEGEGEGESEIDQSEPETSS